MPSRKNRISAVITSLARVDITIAILYDIYTIPIQHQFDIQHLKHYEKSTPNEMNNNKQPATNRIAWKKMHKLEY